MFAACSINKRITASVFLQELRATSTDVRLRRSLASTFALLVINSCAASVLLLCAALWGGVVVCSTWRRCWGGVEEVLLCAVLWGGVEEVLLCAALWGGVGLFTSVPSMSALWVNNSCAASLLFFHAAWWRGDWLFTSLASIFASWVINSCTASVLLYKLEVCPCMLFKSYINSAGYF